MVNGEVNDCEPTGAAVKKPHLFLTDENVASSATLQVLGEVMWRCLHRPVGGVVRTADVIDGAGDADEELFLQALIVPPLQRGRWRTFSLHPLMVLIQKGGLLFLIREGFLRQIQGQERAINKECTKHTRPWIQENFMEV